MTENLTDKTKKKKKKKKMRSGVKDMETDHLHHHHHPPFLHNEVVLENILNRVPVKPLIRCGCVCKLWYKSIHDDPHFASSHSLQSQKNPCLIFSFLNVIDSHNFHHHHGHFRNLFLCSSSDEYEKKKEDDDHGFEFAFLRKKASVDCKVKRELVGYCNGLACLKQMGLIFEIFHPSRVEKLSIFHPIFDGRRICYGFGFDSLTNEYKVVDLIIFHSLENIDQFKCLVFTLGTNSWRETTSPPLSLHQILLRMTPFSKSAIFCGGALFWRTCKSSSDEPNNQILLSFDLHDETFQVIQLPADCVSEQQQQQQQLIHLLEYKGSLCVARLEKILLGSDHEEEEEDQNSISNCCKVHLHILKDKVKQVWIRETFDIPSSLNYSPPCFDDTTTTTITRIVGFSDRVILSWYDRKRLQFYDLHTKHVKVVKPYYAESYLIFENPYSSYDHLCDIDYQLNIHIENLLSLQTLLPEGARKSDGNALEAILKQKQRTIGGFLLVYRKSPEYYVFN